jgi:hypothetical protein
VTCSDADGSRPFDLELHVICDDLAALQDSLPRMRRDGGAEKVGAAVTDRTPRPRLAVARSK